MSKAEKFDVAIIGAGPAGIMAAIESVKLGLSVALVERNPALGKKLLLTGNGRCNITNAEFDLKKLVKNYNNGEFLFHAFSTFGPKETISFFEKIGIETKVENNKRVFPLDFKAEGVLKILNKYLANNNVHIFLDSETTGVNLRGKKINSLVLRGPEGNFNIVAEKYILATGGKSYPQTGSDGSGYALAEKVGHTVVKTRPALASIKLKEPWVKDLQGISLEEIKISVFQKRPLLKEYGEIIFTHFGISGPAILNISGLVGDLLEKGEVKMSIDFFPLLNQEELLGGLEDVLKENISKTTKNILSIFVPERMAECLLSVAGIDKNKTANNMSKLERSALVKILKNFEITPESVLGFDLAMVTRGGVSLKEIDHKTMKSKIINNLFFAGEIIDVDGKTGGFNLQACWSTGYLAGKSAGFAFLSGKG